jgi:MFS superfamily sulfate permease-like transporter
VAPSPHAIAAPPVARQTVQPSASTNPAGGGAQGAWRADIRAGLVVFLVALPLCLGIALASGAPLFSGIITGIVGGLVVSWLSGSQLMVSGPAAGLTAIVAASILELGSYAAFALAVVLAGVLQLTLSLLRAGAIAHFFPSSVIKGMLAAIGITLILKQLPYAFGAAIGTGGAGVAGADAEGGGTLAAIAAAVAHPRVGALVIAATALALLAAWDHPRLAGAKRLLPAPLAAAILGILANFLFGATMPALAVPREALVNLPADGRWSAVFTLPDWTQLTAPGVYTVALTLALVASLETLLSLEATDKLDPLRRVSSGNRELMAQGVGNMLSGLAGGLPMTGVIVRSAVNIDAGGRTRRSAFFHGVFLTAAVVAFPGLLNQIPLAALAVILIYTGYKLAHPATFRHAYAIGTTYFIPFAVTVAAILATDLLIGIAIGLAVGAGFVLFESYRHAYVYHREESADHHHVRLSLAEEVSFLNKARIAAALHGVPHGCVVTVDGSRCRYIDPDVIEILHEFRDRAASREQTIQFVSIPERAALRVHH